jgi:glycine dehydrogenase
MALRLSGLEINVGPVSVSATATALQITTIHCTFQEPSLMTQTLSQLENRGAFIERHIGPDAQQQQEMLKTVGADSLNALIGQIVPQSRLRWGSHHGFAALAELKAIAGLNKRYKSYIGMGYTNVQLPPVILRNMLENPGWYTAYTPYQPEVSQGRLEALLNFQQVTLDLTDIAASLLDEATAAAEAMAMAKRVSKLKNANRFFVAADVHPQTLDVVRTRAETFGFDVIVDADKVLDHQDVFGVLLQQVGTTGEVHDYGALIAELKSRKVVVSVAADFMALVLLTARANRARISYSALRTRRRWATAARTRRSSARKMNSNVPCRPYYRRLQRRCR